MVGNMSYVQGGFTDINPFLSAGQVPALMCIDPTGKDMEYGSIKMAVDLGYYGGEIIQAEYSITSENGEMGGSAIQVKNRGTILDITLFPGNKSAALSLSDMDIRATYQLADATSITVKSYIAGDGSRTRGIGKVSNLGPSKPVAPFALKNFGVKRIGIADYKKVVAEVCCYREAEVSHIENIMAREFKSKSTARERIEETTVTTETETEVENLTDTVSTERYEMQNEVAKIIEQDKQTAGYANVSGSAYGVTFEAGGSYATNNAKAESNRQAVIESKELTQRAMERIITRFRKEVTTKITESYKEENSHIFDNRAGENHVSGVYRFINAVYKNQIYNYGKRMMYEFAIPQPSKLYRYGMTIVPGMPPTDNGFERPMPVPPPVPTINNATDLSLYNYVNEAAKYGADTEAPPSSSISIGKSYQGRGQNGSHSNNFNDIRVPEGYIANSASYEYAQRESGNHNLKVNLMIGDNSILINNQETKSGSVYLIPDYYSSETVPVSIVGWDLGAYAFNVTVYFTRNEEIFRAWQVKTFTAIRTAYNAKLEEYYRLMSERREQATQPDSYLRGNNPLFYRQIEQITLKKYCMAYLMPEANMGQGFHNGNSFISDIISGTNLDNYASLVKFLEQAFEWNIMSYNFYPYYWGKRQDWTELYQSEDDDPVFRSFMQSGMARVIVTVRPGFEDAVMYFRSTGQIWNGQTTPVLGDPLYLGITDELKEQEYIVEETWETLVPTTLTALQRSGVAVDVDGLPCGGGCEDPEIQNPLVPNKSQLGPEVPPVQ